MSLTTTLLSSFVVSSFSFVDPVVVALLFYVVDDDTTTTIGAALVAARVTVNPFSTVSFDIFGHSFVKTPCRRCSLGFFGRRVSPLENSHPCSSSACDHRGIRKAKPYGHPPWLEFSSYVGE